MGLKKKKNIIVLTFCVIICFIMYQLYFFTTITSETANMSVFISDLDHKIVKEVVHLRSKADKFINENGVLKGVYRANVLKYRPDSEYKFKCLNSEQFIAYERLNDDYCDCDDGTDEPSTSACTNGTFYCDSQYKRSVLPNTVPSGKVNDGICDCCDGSDEWLHDSNKKLLSQSSSKHYRYYVDKCPDVCDDLNQKTGLIYLKN